MLNGIPELYRGGKKLDEIKPLKAIYLRTKLTVIMTDQNDYFSFRRQGS